MTDADIRILAFGIRVHHEHNNVTGLLGCLTTLF